MLFRSDDLSENQKATENVMKAIEAGIITVTTKGRLVELEAEAGRIRDAICLDVFLFIANIIGWGPF